METLYFENPKSNTRETCCPFYVWQLMPYSCEQCGHCVPGSIDLKREAVLCRAGDELERLKTINPQLGDILLVHTESIIGSIIQFFQKKTHELAGFFNHSGIVQPEVHDVYVQEATQLHEHKLKAAVRPTLLSNYTGNTKRYTLMLLRPTMTVHTVPKFERVMLQLVGMPYDYVNLVKHQVIRILTGGLWTGRKKKKAWRKLICQEYTMTVYDRYCGIFPNCHQGAVEDIWESEHFEKYVYIKEPLRDGRWVLLEHVQRIQKEVPDDN